MRVGTTGDGDNWGMGGGGDNWGWLELRLHFAVTPTNLNLALDTWSGRGLVASRCLAPRSGSSAVTGMATETVLGNCIS